MTEELASAPTTVATPYIGPRPFRAEEHEYFFGREREARDLLSLVIAERLTLFYAQSGAGKSSLINTRLLPGLRKAGFVPLPVSRVSGTLPTAISSVRNIYIFNLLLSLLAEQQNLAPLANMSLIDCLANLASDDGQHFYLSAAAAPAPVSGSTSLPAPPTALPTDNNDDDAALEYTTPAHVLIIDQFEELFTTHVDRWPERADFFRQLQEAQERDPLLWVVLVMREDFVAELDPYTNLLTDKLRIRYYMQRMGLTAAQQAIQQPARKHGRPFTDDALTALVDNLSRIRVMGQRDPLPGQYVEPVQLQVVCLQLWANLQNRPPGSITIDDLQEAGDVDRALADYYEQSLRQVQERLPGLVSEIVLRDWFSKRLITESGTRGLVNQGATTTGGLPNEVVQLLDTERYLVRRESRAGGVWCELTHDRFVQPILDANQAWAARNLNPLTLAALAWRTAGEPPSQLYRDRQLADAADLLLRTPEAFGELEQRFVAAGQAAEKQRKERRQRLQTVAGLLAILLLTGLTTWALWSANQARRAEGQAVIAQKTAESASALAQHNAHHAATAEAQAKVEARLALQAKAIAEVARTEADEQRSQAEIAKVTAEAANVIAQHNANNAATAEAQAQTEATAALQAKVTAEAARAETEKLQQQIQADRLTKIASLTNIDKTLVQYPQRALLLAVEAVHTINPPVPSSLAGLHELLARTGGKGFASHASAVRSVAFSPDGRTLASGSLDSTIRLWSLADPGVEPIVLRGHEHTVLSVAFSPDSHTLASGSFDKTIRLWSLADPNAEPIVLRGHTDAVRSIAFSPDGQTLASSSGQFNEDSDNTIRLWSLADLSVEPLVLYGHEDAVQSIAFSPDGQTLASGSSDNTIRLWSLADPNAEPLVLRGHADAVWSVVFSPDGQTLASSGGGFIEGSDNTIRLWSLADPNAEPFVLYGHEDAVQSIAFSPDGQTLASGSSDNTIRLWSLTSLNAEPLMLRGHTDAVRSVAFSPNGQTLASGSSDSSIHLWSLANPIAEPVVLRSHTDAVESIAFSPDGQTLASGSSDGTIRLWSLTSPITEPLVLRSHTDAVWSVVFNPNGQTLASGSSDGTIRLWSLTSPITEPLVLRGHTDAVRSVAFSPNGQTLASGSLDGTIRLWSLVDPSARPTMLEGYEPNVLSVAFSPDGQILASGHAGDHRNRSDSIIRLWSLAGPSVEPVVLTGHEDAVRGVTFSPDGQTLASGSSDSTIRLWSLANLNADPIVLRNYISSVWSVAFSPDGHTLASGNSNSAIGLWRGSANATLVLACATAGRNLRQEEWQRYFPKEPYRRTCPHWPAEEQSGGGYRE